MASSRKKSRATLATVAFDASIRSSLVHLPLALYAPLLERGVPPQSIVVEVSRADKEGDETTEEGNEGSINKIYVGWSGMSAAPLGASSGAFTSNGASSSSLHTSSATSVISMSSTLSSIFSPPLEAGMPVRITLLRSPPLPIANRVDVVPLTPDDWEILSLNAEEVESGMLGQVRAAKEGMTIVVHVGRQGRTICRFRVVSCDPPTQNYSSCDASLPRAVRLSTNTEVVIAPQSRMKAPGDRADETSQPQHDVNAVSSLSSLSSLTKSQTSASAQQYLSRSLFKLLPIEYSSFGSQSSLLLSQEDASVLSLAFGGTLVGQGRCAVTKMPCPSAPDVFSSFGKSINSFTLGAKDRSAAKDDSPTSPNESKEGKLPARATTSAYFTSPSNEEEERKWPARHVWMPARTRTKLGVRDWDLIRFSAPAPSASISRPTSPEPREDSNVRDATPPLAGIAKTLKRCIDQVQTSFRSRSLTSLQVRISGKRLPRTNSALLMTGSPGSGKTSLAKVLSAELSKRQVATIYIDCALYSEERLSSMRQLISQWLSSAAWHSPTLLILDNLDRIVPSDQEHVDSPRSSQIAESMMQKIKEVIREYPIFIVAIAQNVNSLNKVCVGNHVFGETVELKAPDKEARRDILQYLVAQRKRVQPESEFNPVMIASQSEGYLPADLKDLVERAVHQSAIRNAAAAPSSSLVSSSSSSSSKTRLLTMDDFEQAQKGFTPLSLRDIKLTRSSTTWKDVGGLQETRRVLRETLEWPSKYAKIFERCPLRLRSGLLLYGYPGCGKTLLAGAVAKECGLNFISVKGPEILNKYIGASEKSVRDLFDRAQAAKPCILFFDEFDSIAPKRGHDSTGVTDRVVNQLLTQMDGAEGLSGVYILAATSRPDLIDSALLRPGRLDKSLLCDLPGEEDRLEILQVVSSGKIQLDSTVSLPEWARRTEGFSGADLQALLYNANLEAVHESMNRIEEMNLGKGGRSVSSSAQRSNDPKSIQFFHLAEKETKSKLSGAEHQALQKRMELMLTNSHRNVEGDEESEETAVTAAKAIADDQLAGRRSIFVNQEHVEKCFKTTRQSVPADEQRRLKKIYQNFIGERDGKYPNGEGSREVGARESLM
ncbi:hypothetical protein CBS101457_004052 [Exobasidium rhododendri]|nr:hypothetical protein CBS101457_004052 [Exobasidium rhododendri]